MHQEFDKIIQHWLDSDYIEELPHEAIKDKKAFYLAVLCSTQAG